MPRKPIEARSIVANLIGKPQKFQYRAKLYCPYCGHKGIWINKTWDGMETACICRRFGLIWQPTGPIAEGKEYPIQRLMNAIQKQERLRVKK